jgi:hypothetical protein
VKPSRKTLALIDETNATVDVLGYVLCCSDSRTTILLRQLDQRDLDTKLQTRVVVVNEPLPVGQPVTAGEIAGE